MKHLPDGLWERMCKLVHPTFLHEWFSRPNPAFDGRTPLAVVRDGDVELLELMVERLEAGDAT